MPLGVAVTRERESELLKEDLYAQGVGAVAEYERECGTRIEGAHARHGLGGKVTSWQRRRPWCDHTRGSCSERGIRVGIVTGVRSGASRMRTRGLLAAMKSRPDW